MALLCDKMRSFMRQAIVVDGRNLYDPSEMANRGFTYWGTGCGVSPNIHEVQQRALDQEPVLQR